MKYIIKIENKYLVSRRWYFNGKFHREDGPAAEWMTGAKYWYIDGKSLSQKEFKARKA